MKRISVERDRRKSILFFFPFSKILYYESLKLVIVGGNYMETSSSSRSIIDSLFDEIRNCDGASNCWGSKFPWLRKPVVLPCLRQSRIMVITEQRNVPKSWMSNPEEVPRNWNSSKTLLEEIKKMKKGLSKKGIVPRMDKYLFNHAFISDFDEEKECFHNFY